MCVLGSRHESFYFAVGSSHLAQKGLAHLHYLMAVLNLLPGIRDNFTIYDQGLRRTNRFSNLRHCIVEVLRGSPVASSASTAAPSPLRLCITLNLA